MSSETEYEYLEKLDTLADSLGRVSKAKPDRTGTGTVSSYGDSLRHVFEAHPDDAGYRVPLFNSKKIYYKSVIDELLWFLRGDTNINKLDCGIWNEWADEKGDLGPVYGAQWRDYNGDGIDQIANVIEGLRDNPFSRRHMVTAWNPSQLDKMALPPCHFAFQFVVHDSCPTVGLEDRKGISLIWYQRSADIFLGVPFNILSYTILLLIVAKTVGYHPMTVNGHFGDLHLYSNHLQAAKGQLSRQEQIHDMACPTLSIDKDLNTIEDIEALTVDDFTVRDYKPLGAIPAPIAV